jgi:NADH:ubiquinone oxidoreductase subunit 6 (subunit J)
MDTNSYFFFLNILILVFSVVAVINFNPIFAVLSMIVAFLLAVIYFSIIGAYLISMIFLIVYVGAVAILFVFSLMLFERIVISFNSFFFSISFVLSIFYIVFFVFFNLDYFSNVFEFVNNFSNDFVLQVTLFDYGYPYMLLNGIILFFFTVAVGFIFSGSKGNIKFLLF